MVNLNPCAYAIENDASEQAGKLEISSSEFSLNQDLLTEDIEIDQAPINPDFNRQRSNEDEENFGLNVDPLKIYTDYDALNQNIPNRQKASFIPSYYDLRNEGRVTPMRNQGPNGSCWAFATYGSAESVLLPRENTDFSEKNLRNTHGYDWGPKDGGTYQVSAAYLSRWSGPISERDEPYHPYDFYSPRGLYPIKELAKAMYIPDVRNINDARILKEAIMDYGAAYTTVNGSEYFTNMYSMGHYNPGNGWANHAVTIIGWDDNYSASNFTWRPPGNGAWIVKNSWGQHWGSQGGYYYVSYYDFHIAKNNCIFVMKNKESNKSIWYHDYLGMTSNIGRGREGWFSNVFGPSNQNLEISEVGVFVPTNNVSYEVYVNTNIGGNSGFNNRVKVASGTFDYAGYQTVKFRPQQIPRGAYFAPIIRFTTTGYSYPIPVEKPIWGYSSRATASSGQSYISYDGYNWSDITNQMYNTNVCVKAFTKPSGSTDNQDLPINTDIKKVESIIANEDLINLSIGESQNINAEVLPNDASNKSLSYSSTNTYVASVSPDGQIRALREGTATITISATDGSGVATSVNVNVKRAENIPGNIFNVNLHLPRDNPKLGQNLPLTVNVRDKYQRNLRYALVNVSLADDKSKEAYTDYNGNFKVDLPTDHIKTAGTYKLDVKVTGDSYEDFNKSYDIKIEDENSSPSNDSFDLRLNLDKNEYLKGQRIPIKISTSKDGNPIGNVPVNIEITTPNGIVHKNSGFTKYNGITSYNYLPDQNAPAGEYKVKVIANSYNAKKEISFVVKEKDNGLNLSYTTDKEIYYYGERANIKFTLKDANYRILSNAGLDIRVTGPNKFDFVMKKITDYYGNAKMYIQPDSSMKPGTYTVEVKAKDKSLGKLDSKFDIEFIDPNNRPLSLRIIDIKDSYKLRNRPIFTAHVKDEKNLNLRYAKIKFSLEDGKGKILAEKSATTTYTGKISFTAPVLNAGKYKLKVTADRDSYQNLSEEYNFLVK